VAKPIWTSNPGRRPEHMICCWPECLRPSPEFPLCWYHCLGAYLEVQASLSNLLEHRPGDHSPPDTRTGHVYFIRFRDRIKIGYSISPTSRIGQQPHDEVLAIMPGTLADEKRCHAAFAHLRENGEWFRPEPDLLAFIAQLGAEAS